MDEDNDGRFPDDSPVEVRYPRSKQEEVRELAVLRDGRKPPRGTPSRNLYYPCCFRDSSEIRHRAAAAPGVAGNEAAR